MRWAVLFLGLFVTGWLLAEEPADDHVPLVAFALSTDGPSATERAKLGVLKPMPRKDFESLLKEARLAQLVRSQPPRLIEARYRAQLNGDSLLGSAEWKFHYSADRPGILTLEPFQLAIRRARWADDRPVIWGDLERGAKWPGLELLVPRQNASLVLEWSAQGVRDPYGIRFDLRMPIAPVATLELDLPQAFTPRSPHSNCRISNPAPAARADRQIWNVMFGGVSPVELTLRSEHESHLPRFLVRQNTQRWELAPTRAEGLSILNIDVPAGGVNSLNLKCDQELRPIRIEASGLSSWDHAIEPKGEGQLNLRFREPFSGGEIRIRAVSRLPDDGRAWALPGIGRPDRGDLWIDPELSVEEFQPGDVRVTRSFGAMGKPHEISFEAALIASAESPRRPTLRLRPLGTSAQYRVESAWLVWLGGSTLTSRLHVEVNRGAVWQIPLRIPAGWSVESVNSPTSGVIDRWIGPNKPTGSSQPLTVELLQPVTPGRPLTLELRLSQPGPWGQTGLSFPDLLPKETRGPQSILAIFVSPAFVAVADTSSQAVPWVPSLTPVPEIAGVASVGQPQMTYAFRGATVEGNLRLKLAATRLDIQTQHDLARAEGRWSLRSQFRVQPISGGPRHLPICASSPVQGTWTWRVVAGDNRIESFRISPQLILPYFANPTPLGVLTAQAYEPHLRYRLLSLARPLQSETVLESRLEQIACSELHSVRHVTSLLGYPGGLGLSVAGAALARPKAPAMLVAYPILGRASTNWKVQGGNVQTEGLLPQSLLPNDALDVSRFRSGIPTPRLTILPDLLVSTKPVASPEVYAPSLLVIADGSDRLRCRLQFQTRGNAGVVPLTLPEGAKLFRADVGGRPIALWPLPGETWEIPVHRVGLSVSIEYTLSVEPVTVFARLSVELPKSRLCPPILVTWATSPELVALYPSESLAIWVARVDYLLPILWGGALALAVCWVVLLVRWPAQRKVVMCAWMVCGVIGMWLVPWPLVEPFFAFWLSSVVVGVCVLPRAGFPLLLVLTLSSAGEARGPAPLLIHLVGPVDTPEKQTALVPAELERRLREQTRFSSRGAVITSAEYEGRLVDSVAACRAKWEVHCLGDEAHMLTVPLTGVAPREILLDGAPVTAHGTPERGFQIAMPAGGGVHQLQIEFFLTVQTRGAEREIRCGIPEIPQSRLVFDAPEELTFLRAVNWRGAQKLTSREPRVRLEADLGRVSILQIRWRPAGPTPPPHITAKSACLWDIAENSAMLLLTTRFQVSNGEVRQLRLKLPAEMELAVRSLSVRPLEPGNGNLPPFWLRDWQINDDRTLVVDLQAPVSGTILLQVDFRTKEFPRGTMSLFFPSPIATETSGYVGYRLRNLRGELLTFPGLRRVESSALLNELAQANLERGGIVAFAIEAAPYMPSISLRIKPDQPELRGRLVCSWRVGPRTSELVATTTWTGRDLSYLEWDVSESVVITDIRGAELRSWARRGTRVQVWLRQPQANVTLTCTGTLVRSAPTPPPAKLTVNLPSVRLVGVLDTAVQWELSPMSGWSLRLAPQNYLRILPNSSGEDLSVLSTRPEASLAVILTKAKVFPSTVVNPQPATELLEALPHTRTESAPVDEPEAETQSFVTAPTHGVRWAMTILTLVVLLAVAVMRKVSGLGMKDGGDGSGQKLRSPTSQIAGKG